METNQHVTHGWSRRRFGSQPEVGSGKIQGFDNQNLKFFLPLFDPKWQFTYVQATGEAFSLGAYLGFCQGGCTFLADLPPPPTPPDPDQNNADQLSKDCCLIYNYV
jgi:hypothetical protein